MKDAFQSSLASEMINYALSKRPWGVRSHIHRPFCLRLISSCAHWESPPRISPLTHSTSGAKTLEVLSSNGRLARMRTIRNFCLYRRRADPVCFIPDPTQFPQARPTIEPYIFSEDEVARILSHSKRIPVSARSPLRRAATRLAIILLYTTGLRRGELLRLTAADYDPSTRTFMIRASKFHKSRLLPVQKDVAAEIERFLKALRSIQPPLPASPLFRGPYPVVVRRIATFSLEKICISCLPLPELRNRTVVSPAFTTSASVLRSMPWYAGTATGMTFKPSCPCLRLTWAMFRCSPLTTTCDSSHHLPPSPVHLLPPVTDLINGEGAL